MKNILQLLLFFTLFWVSELAQAQPSTELGKPIITTWLPKDYGAAPSNWAIVQDNRGVMYFGNADGVLEFDGVSWRLIQFPSKSICRSLAKDKNGRIYVGSFSDFGYLAPDSLGQMHFVSLLPLVPESAQDFKDTRDINVLNEAVYFTTWKWIYRLKDGQIKTWKSSTNFYYGFVVDGHYYTREIGKGLLRMEGDSLRLVPGGELFAHNVISVMLPFSTVDNRNGILIGDSTSALIFYDGETFKPFTTEADSFLQGNLLYPHGAVLSEHRILLNTIDGGAIMLDKDGSVIQTIDYNDGLHSNSVYEVYSDPLIPEAQWLALGNSIARMELTAPANFFYAESGLTSRVYGVHSHDGVIYVATTAGIFYLDTSTATFKIVNTPVTQGFSFLTFEDQTLAATAAGIFALDKNQAHAIRKSADMDFISTTLIRSKTEPKRVFVGLVGGMTSIYKDGNSWREGGRAIGVDDEVRSLAEAANGDLWAGTHYSGTIRFRFSEQNKDIWENVQIHHFGLDDGLTDGFTTVSMIDGIVYFSTNEGIYRFNEENQRFVKDSTFMVLGSLAGGVVLREQEPGKVWVFGKGLAQGTKQEDGAYKWLQAPFRRFSNEAIESISFEDDDVIWFSDTNGLVRYDMNAEINYDTDYPALIRRVVVGGDSLVYGGTALENPVSPEIDYAHNNFHFEFSASSYEDKSGLEFQTFLEGFDDHWSNWNNKAEKEYTNLPEGDYQFRVQAKSGWTLKTLKKKRNLFFFLPLEGSFKITFVFGDKAVSAIEKSDFPDEVIDTLRNARKYAEGRGLQLQVTSADDVENVKKLVEVKLSN